MNGLDLWTHGVSESLSLKAAALSLLLAFGLTLPQVMTALQNANLNVGGNTVSLGAQSGETVVIASGLTGREQVASTNSFILKSELGKSAGGDED